MVGCFASNACHVLLLLLVLFFSFIFISHSINFHCDENEIIREMWAYINPLTVKILSCKHQPAEMILRSRFESSWSDGREEKWMQRIEFSNNTKRRDIYYNFTWFNFALMLCRRRKFIENLQNYTPVQINLQRYFNFSVTVFPNDVKCSLAARCEQFFCYRSIYLCPWQ